MSSKIAILGDSYGRLLVIGDAKSMRVKGGTKRKVLCICACGRPAVIRVDALRSGRTRSCGCFNAERRVERLLTHGMHDTKIYQVWQSMLQRCRNQNDHGWERYGGRGIRVCERWHDFETFWDDVRDGYGPGMALDRINNDGPYAPWNCRWVSVAKNNRNRAPYANRWLGFLGSIWFARLIKFNRRWEC